MIRSISHSEASTLLDCQAKHAFAYTGALTRGDALQPITKHHRLREGTAWGIAMAHYHASRNLAAAPVALVGSQSDAMGSGVVPMDGVGSADPMRAAASALTTSLRIDQGQMVIPDQHEFNQMNAKLKGILDHYIATATPIGIDRQELKLDVPIRSRASKRASTRYRFTGFVDGIHTTPDGDWIVEFKLRGSLSSLEQVTLGRQIRWYAWAWREATGRDVVGVIVDERLNQEPKAVRILKSGLPSHAKDQITTAAMYQAACNEANVSSEVETLDALASRRWQARHEVFLTAAEIDEAGRQLTSMARLVGQMDNGDLFPIRNPSQFRCPSCAFKDICNAPEDAELVDALFVRNPAKRDRVAA